MEIGNYPCYVTEWEIKTKCFFLTQWYLFACLPFLNRMCVEKHFNKMLAGWNLSGRLNTLSSYNLTRRNRELSLVITVGHLKEYHFTKKTLYRTPLYKTPLYRTPLYKNTTLQNTVLRSQNHHIAETPLYRTPLYRTTLYKKNTTLQNTT